MGLTLKDRLEKNRKNVVYDIKQQIGVGLANGNSGDAANDIHWRCFLKYELEDLEIEDLEIEDLFVENETNNNSESKSEYVESVENIDEVRAARGEDGKTHYIPEDMKYPEWKEKKHLDDMGAVASNIGDILMFRKNVCISEVLEEKFFRDKIFEIRTCKNGTIWLNDWIPSQDIGIFYCIDCNYICV